MQKAAGRRRSADRRLLCRHRLGAEGRRLQGTAPADAVRDDSPDQPDRHVQRAALRRHRDDRQRAIRGWRARGVREHCFDRRLRRAGRPDRLLRFEGRRRRHDAPCRPRPRAVRDPRQHDRPRPVRHATARRTARGGPREARRGRALSPSASASQPSTPSWPVTSSRTGCSTARRSGSTARCACLRANAPSRPAYFSRSTSIAMPMPPATHIDSMP